ncbi:MAG: hypothetical protein M3R17_02570 [Bacteroidota bacterium]|nr:hypothetical protein [Bacteroidota bacterium]
MTPSQLFLQVRIIGVVLILLAIMHVFFPKRFEWKKELAGLNLLNNQMMYVHTFFVALTILLMGVLCIFYAEDLFTMFGSKIAFGMFIFWAVRLFFQFFVYSRKLWKGKKFETIIHILFSMLWTYFSYVFFMVYYWGGIPGAIHHETLTRI